jgi:hypothetical protein
MVMLSQQEAPMKKSLAAVTAAVLIAGSAVSYTAFAQQPPSPRHVAENAWRPSAADRAACANARVATIHARLALTPDQEKLWPPVENVLRDLAQKRAERMEQMRVERERDDKAAPPDAIDRLRRSADFMAETGNDLKRLADAAQPLYEKLDDAQKRRLQRMVRHGMRERVHREMRERSRERFSEWRDRYRHWQDRDDDHRAGPRTQQQHDEDYQDEGPDDHAPGDQQPSPKGERL